MIDDDAALIRTIPQAETEAGRDPLANATPPLLATDVGGNPCAEVRKESVIVLEECVYDRRPHDKSIRQS